MDLKNNIYSNLLNKLNEIILIINNESKEIEYANTAFEKFFGIKLEDFQKTRSICDEFLENESYISKYMENGMYWIDYILRKPTVSHKVLLKNKDDFFFHFNIYIKKIDNNKFMVTLSDITEITSIQEELKTEKIILKEYKKIVDISNIVSKANKQGTITYVNEKFCDITGYTREELLGKQHNIVRHEDVPKEVFKDLWNTIKKGGIWNGVIKNKRKDGSAYYVDATIAPIMDAEGNIKEYIGIRKDVTEEAELKESIKEQNLQLKKLATRDSLTDTFNRRGLDDILHNEIKDVLENKEKELSIIMCDIDFFKKVNDTYGHNKGDELLTQFVNLLKKNLKKKDTISRWGGEEFIIVLPETDKGSASKLANFLRKTVSEYQFMNIDKQITSSFGVACVSELEKGLSIDATMASLTKKADIRLYEAKKQGRNKVVAK